MKIKACLALAVLLPAIAGADGYYAMSWNAWGTYANDGTWASAAQLTPAKSTSLASGDIDGDGQQDLVASFTSGGVWALTAGGWGQIHGVAADLGVAVGDLNGDGADEIIMSRTVGGVSQYDSIANATTPVNPNPAQRIATGDLDGDGNDEVLMSFSAYGTYADNGTSAWLLNAAFADQLAAGDIDGDGNDEALMTYASGGVYANQGTLASDTQLHPLYSDLGLLAADIDGDGDDEVILDFSAYGIYANDGALGLDTLINAAGAEAMAAGDADGDGKEELLVSWSAYGIYKLVPGGASTALESTPADALAVVAVPEPATLSLFALLGGAMLWIRKRLAI